ncbi:5'/3'-nucleotidase SurE [Thermosulfurimonas marina]|uniref:5'-nucleotidase SurE n=1 Tax=Thermosulfurimonas marina TaxID=2047767 RepID=A0A6H1WT13_9BACT|nr:5'/3'-nucleotidase SurE [Thermosulfurimonas marina]QJA06357.1 5'/3'-nucleotidase SurE [Thermosulfurimonas marina]
MKILLTNDDGIYAEGLCALYRALSLEHEVVIVAPEAERSAVGHAITLSDPLRVRVVRRGRDFWGYAVNGTPADCVKLAFYELVGPVDLVVSGINRGANVGINVLYSGTVSAATEAAILGRPALAVSLAAFSGEDYCFAAYFTALLVENLPSLSSPFCLNVNIPHLPAHLIKGIKVTRQGTRKLKERFEKRVDPHGNIYYWQCGEEFLEEDPDTDVVALKSGYISITPLAHDLTDYKTLSFLQDFRLSY